MRANGEVLAPQGKVTMAFSVQGGRSRVNVVATGPKRAKIAPRSGNPGNVRLNVMARQ
jgi:hypothetical protein